MKVHVVEREREREREIIYNLRHVILTILYNVNCEVSSLEAHKFDHILGMFEKQ